MKNLLLFLLLLISNQLMGQGISVLVEYADSCNLSTPNQPVLSQQIACPGQVVLASTDPVVDATFYIWSLPSQSTIIGDPPYSNQISFYVGNSGMVSVQAANDCDTTFFSEPALLEVPTYEGFDTTYVCGVENSPCGLPVCNQDIPIFTSEGCDSTVHFTTIAVRQSNEIIMLNQSFCQGDPDARDSVVILTDQYGCDSTIIFRPIILPNFQTVLRVNLCEGESYQGQVFLADTLLTDSLMTTEGCDSIFISNVKVSPNYEIVLDTTFMIGGLFEGTYYFNDTTLVKNLQSQAGCDSMVTINIMVTTVSASGKGSGECEVYLYPVPANDKICLNIKSCKDLEIKAFYNQTGRNVLQQNWINTSQQEVDIRALPPGVYYLQIGVGDDLYVLRFVKIEN